MRRVMEGNGKFSTLATRDLVSVQVAHLRTRFELAEKSVLAEKAVALVNEGFDRYESERDQIRVKPEEMVVEHQGKMLILPARD